MLRSTESKSVSVMKANDADDLAIVRRAQSGDGAAFDLLFMKYQSRILSLLLRYTRNYADAEDASQDAFLKAYTGLKQFRGESAFYTWLHRIAVNSANSLMKARARGLFGPTRDELAICDGTDEVPAQLREVETPDQLACAGEIQVIVDATLASLPRGHRTAIMLREVDGRSYAAIATALLIPIGTVRSRVFRARETLDRRLREVVDGGLGRRATRRMPSTAAAFGPAA